ncbi:hypothetical protein Bhyg_15066, partial [Pseudolycoriella hygida]
MPAKLPTTPATDSATPAETPVIASGSSLSTLLVAVFRVQTVDWR